MFHPLVVGTPDATSYRWHPLKEPSQAAAPARQQAPLRLHLVETAEAQQAGAAGTVHEMWKETPQQLPRASHFLIAHR